MPTLSLVRHGRAAAAWDGGHDPGLDDLGRAQARDMARLLAPLGPMMTIVSPMARTCETAAPLAAAWGAEPRIEPRVGEIPSPTPDLKARGQWLREVAGRVWPELDQPLRDWRARVLAALAEVANDTVVVTHYIAINAAAGAATGDDRVVNFRPDYCSITVLRHTGNALALVRRGNEGATRVL
jgi:broad specificity phosphatase PhoE